SGTVRSVASLPRGTFSQLPWLAESQMQSSSRSSSSPSRMPVPRSTVSPVRANGSASSLMAAIRSRSASGGRARGSGLASRGLVQPGDVRGEQQPPGWPLGPAPQGQVVEEAAQVDDGPLADRRGDGLVAGEAAAPGPLVVVSQEPLDVLAGELGQAADVRVGGG